MSSGTRDVPPYVIPVSDQQDNVKVYKVHTPFNPTASTIGQGPIIQGPIITNEYKVPTQSTHAQSPDKHRFVSYDSELGRSPGMISCTNCREQVLTQVTHKVGTYAWLMCILFILCGLVIGCCLLPFFLKFFKDVYHSCPKCHRVLHVEKKRCC